MPRTSGVTKTFQLVASVILSALLLHAAGPAPVLNKPQLEKYLRYAEGFTASVHFLIDDPTSSPFPNYYRVVVHLTTDAGARLDRVYYVTPDGQKLINGSIWDLQMSPFTESLSHMPDGGYSFGPANAKVKIVIFSDFECPFCKEFAKTIRGNLAQKYPGEVRVVFENFPIDSLHPWARAAAEASHCIGDQNPAAFWSFHDWIFSHQEEVKKDNLRAKVLAFAKDQNLDSSKIESCIDQRSDKAAVDNEVAAGKQLQVQQTPTVFINGRTVPGALPWPSLDSVIQLELNRPASVPDAKAEECCQLPIPAVRNK